VVSRFYCTNSIQMITLIDEARFVTFTDFYFEMDRKVPRNKELHL